MRLTSFLVLLFVVFSSCGSDFTPRPRGYFRFDFPEKKYVRFDSTCAYVFEYPTYAKIVSDNERVTEPCWINLEFTQYNAKLHISYKTIGKNAQHDSLRNVSAFLEESRRLAYKHAVKADAIDEKIYHNPQKRVYGTLYEIAGNAASQVQFYLTDSTQHFIRGALYFNNVPNKDSLAPVVNFIKQDITHIIETLEWK